MKCVELSEREKRFLHRAKNKNGEAFLYIQEEVEEFKQMIEARAEKAEAEVARIMAIIEKNPYPESVFTKVTDEEFSKIHEILQREMNMPIDRLSGEYMRMLRKQIINEIKKAKEGL